MRPTSEKLLHPMDDLERTRVALYRLYIAALRTPDQVEDLEEEQETANAAGAGELVAAFCKENNDGHSSTS